MTSRPYQSTREKLLARDLARARDALAMAYSGLDRARAGDPWFDIDRRMALVREDMDYLDQHYGGPRHQTGAPAVNVALQGGTFGREQVEGLVDSINREVADGADLRVVPDDPRRDGDNDDGSAA